MDQAVLVTADKRKKFSLGLTLLDIEQYGGVGRPEPLTVFQSYSKLSSSEQSCLPFGLLKDQDLPGEQRH